MNKKTFSTIFPSAIFLSVIFVFAVTLTQSENSMFNPVSVAHAKGKHDSGGGDDHTDTHDHDSDDHSSGGHSGGKKGKGKGGVSHRTTGGHGGSVEDVIFHGKHGKRWTDEWSGGGSHDDDEHDDGGDDHHDHS